MNGSANTVENKRLLTVAPSPHIHSPMNTGRVMREVMLGLLPATAAAVYFFGMPALKLVLVSVVTAVAAEYAWQRLLGLKVTVGDCSAALTGLFLALILPPTAPWWIAAVGAAVSVLLGKQVFGGLGYNPFNPALVGRAFLQISWPQIMTYWVKPLDGVATATPLAIVKEGGQEALPTYLQMFLGNQAGSLGETSALALLAGGLFIMLRGHILPVVPLAYIGTVMAGALAFGQDPLFHLLAGGLMIGAFFMATDPASSPIAPMGKLAFGIGAGLLTILIRATGGFPEGVCFSILIMNMTVPLIDGWTIPKRFGAR